MERITFDGNFCDIAQCRELPCPYDGSCTQKEVWERLKAYEDTGFSPDAIKSTFTPDAIIKMTAQALETTPERLRELAAADKEGRVVVLPCKVGDTVYTINLHKEIVDLTVECFGIDETGELWIFTEDHNKTYVDAIEIRDIDDDVFLTREEAERAMEGQKHD